MKKYILISVVIILAILIFFTLKKSDIAVACPVDNTSPMYGCSSYDEYVNKRAQWQKEADDELKKSVSELYSNDTVKASNSANKIGWDLFAKGDVSTARERFNQAWLIDHNNFVTFWQFAITYAQENKHDIALVNFERAISLFDKKYETGDGDHATLICDRALSYLINASFEKDDTKQKELLDKTINTIEAENKASKRINAECLLTEAQAYGALGDKTNAKVIINQATILEPSMKNSQMLNSIIKDFGLN